MATNMDVVFCIDYTSSMTCDFPQVHKFVTSVSKMFTNGIESLLYLIKFRSDKDSWKIKTHGPTGNTTLFERWLCDDKPSGECPDGYEPVGDALHAALNVDWCSNIKLVFLITDGAPNGLLTPLIGEDPWIISTRYKEEEIILYVIGGAYTIDCDDFYAALAENTNGRFIPLKNAKEIFSRVIRSVIADEATFPQAFSQISIDNIQKNSSFNYLIMKERVNAMINECANMDDIHKFFP